MEFLFFLVNLEKSNCRNYEKQKNAGKRDEIR